MVRLANAGGRASLGLGSAADRLRGRCVRLARVAHRRKRRALLDARRRRP